MKNGIFTKKITMDIQARKISLIQEFLRINSEELINKLDRFLHDEKKKFYDNLRIKTENISTS